MDYVRLYAGPDGVSHFEDIALELSEVAMAPPAPPFLASQPVDASAVLFCQSPPGWEGDWHPAPHRQFVLLLAGELEVEVGDGELRRFGPGSIVLVEDVSGGGHVTRVVSDVETLGVFVQLP